MRVRLPPLTNCSTGCERNINNPQQIVCDIIQTFNICKWHFRCLIIMYTIHLQLPADIKLTITAAQTSLDGLLMWGKQEDEAHVDQAKDEEEDRSFIHVRRENHHVCTWQTRCPCGKRQHSQYKHLSLTTDMGWGWEETLWKPKSPPQDYVIKIWMRQRITL